MYFDDAGVGFAKLITLLLNESLRRRIYDRIDVVVMAILYNESLKAKFISQLLKKLSQLASNFLSEIPIGIYSARKYFAENSTRVGKVGKKIR